MDSRKQDQDHRPELPEVKPEIEGDRWNWFYTCGDCHEAINWHDPVCKHCGRRINWNG